MSGGRLVTDNRIKDRVKGLLAVTPTSGDLSEHAHPQPRAQVQGQPQGQPRGEGEAQYQALQVLTLAQRTADEHLTSARHEAAKIQASAQAAAEQTAREAGIDAHRVRQEADRLLSEAREAAAQVTREARAHAEEVEHEAEQILSDAQAKAEAVAADARAGADELKLQAEQRYNDVVGSLAGKREALQEQIEALERFDREYRARLQTFMQGQLRALWADQPQVTGDVEA
jgi:cell division septum initiation protein DivIVA